MLTDHRAITVAALARPEPFVWQPEPGFFSRRAMICGKTGTPFPLGGTWHRDSRQGYSRRQPENSDSSLLYLEQRSGTPSKFVCELKAPFTPLIASSGTKASRILASCTEVRWMPKRTEMLGVTSSALVHFDVLEDREIRRIAIPSGPSVGLIGEGNLSNDCTVVALGNTSFDVVLVDVLNGRVGPRQNLAEGWPSDSGPLDNLTVSPLASVDGGKLIVVATHGRIYDFDVDLKLTPRRLDPWGLRMAGAKDPSFAEIGLIGIGSHRDVGVTPDGREVFVGGVRDQSGDVNLKGSALPSHIKPFSKNDGRIVAWSLDDGLHQHVSIGTNFLKLESASEAYDQHCSCRGPVGWVLVTYAGQHESVGRFHGEKVAYKLDGSLACVRYGPTRTFEDPALPASIRYRCEAHSVPGRKAAKNGAPLRVYHASNDQWDIEGPLGPSDDIKAYVHELIEDVVDPPPPPDETHDRFRVVDFPSSQSVRYVASEAPVNLLDVVGLANQKWKEDHPS